MTDYFTLARELFVIDDFGSLVDVVIFVFVFAIDLVANSKLFGEVIAVLVERMELAVVAAKSLPVPIADVRVAAIAAVMMTYVANTAPLAQAPLIHVALDVDLAVARKKRSSCECVRSRSGKPKQLRYCAHL